MGKVNIGNNVKIGQGVSIENVDGQVAQTISEAKQKLLGDYIEDIAAKTQIKKMVNELSRLTNTKCNCKGRKHRLNNMHLKLKNILKGF